MKRIITSFILMLLVFNLTSIQSFDAEEALEGSVNLLEVYPSDPSAFTQGLEISPFDDLVIGTGQYGDSYIGILDLEEGNIMQKVPLDDQYFGEGITFTKDYLWQLTWKSELAFKRDPHTFEVIETIPYNGEGWGIAYDSSEDYLWMSNGSSSIQKRQVDDFELIDSVTVTYDGEEIDQINELEFANGSIYANRWFYSEIYQIDPNTGQVIAVYDIQQILDELKNYPNTDNMNVLNGIAHIEDNNFFLTGKYYPFILEVELEK